MSSLRLQLDKLSNRQILSILLFVAIGSSVLSALINIDGITREWLSSYLQNFASEMMGAVFTFAAFELLVGGRGKKYDLVLDMKSRNNEKALTALEELRQRGFLDEGNRQTSEQNRAFIYWGCLQGASLRGANLQGANLSNIDLKGADLGNANLSRAIVHNTLFDNWTTLPNEKMWRHDIDITIFTDPSHPEFWQPDWLG